MDRNIKQSIYEMLETISEALELLRGGGEPGLRRLVADSRLAVTQSLQAVLPDCFDRAEAHALSDEDWLRTAYWIMGELEEPFCPQNAYDRDFQALLNYVWSHSSQELLQTMLDKLRELKQLSAENYNRFVTYFARFPLWGTLDPANGDYDTLKRRAAVLKQHSYDFLWLYQRLEDYLSKRTLYAILKNWAFLDFVEPQTVKSVFPDYWEPDLFPSNDGDVLVDVGAFIGDSIDAYIKMYGLGYKRIYAYEISKDSCDQLRRNIAAMKLHDVIVRRKGAGQAAGRMFVDSNGESTSANQLSQNGSAGGQVDVVPLDDDIQETVTFLKMDIEGAEQSALLGCRRIIQEQQPKLAICTYHGYEDIWKIPFMIDCMRPDYRFYLRHYGGNLIPTEFVLLCTPAPDGKNTAG